MILLTAWLACAGVQAQEVQKVQVGDNQNFGITYSLPYTAVKVQATAVCTQIQAGIFAPYAEKFLGITDAVQADQTDWQITQVTLQPEALPDSSRTYHILFNEKGYLPTFYFTDAGCLWSINQEPQQVAAVDEGVAEASANKPKNSMSAVDVVNEELLRAGSRAKQAEIAARAIFRIRESRLNLLTGEVDNLPADGASFQLVLDNLEAQEAAYMELFTGKQTVTTVTRSFDYVPLQAVKNQVLFRFSRHFGFTDADDLSGEPYLITVNVKEDLRSVPAVVDVKARKKAAQTGIAYAVPGKAQLLLTCQGRTLGEGEWQLGQLGHVEFLPVNQFTNRKAPTKAQFNALTGAIQLFVGNE